jgi:hypothetical protein
MMILIKSAVTGWNPLRGEPEKVGEGEDGHKVVGEDLRKVI